MAGRRPNTRLVELHGFTGAIRDFPGSLEDGTPPR
jgi:hypothetical protein